MITFTFIITKLLLLLFEKSLRDALSFLLFLLIKIILSIITRNYLI